ncbi:hypothetical protein ncot_14015 [Nocardioides sp. JQ2195]|uniref:hypothetical protein n=1 Tax=Nocardioides sp. JQ2195 TaxID=2592334 RepID=UPI00143ECD87|nr:hypothetical protein [Nocardioides sp. JQ2195]QIX27592.1 hypothetical protein ncot_14015 [Nocardioides sp. JQ2195]
MAEDASEPTRVEIETSVWRGAVTLAESVPGGGDWSVVGVEVSALDGSALSAARLRAVPWGELLERARVQVAGSSRRSPFVSPSDTFLTAFTVDRRGKSARTERDYAELAAAYLAFGQERGHKAASHWAKKFGNRSAQRWRMDIKRAKEHYLEPTPEGTLALTDEAWLLIYGEDFFDVLEVENAIEADVEQIEDRIEDLVGQIERLETSGLAMYADAQRDVGELARRNGVQVTRTAVQDAWLKRLAETDPALRQSVQVAQELSRQRGVNVSTKAVLDARLRQERQKLAGVNSPHAPE